MQSSQPLPGTVYDIYGDSSSGRRLQQAQLQHQLQQLQKLQADGWEEEQQELQQLQQQPKAQEGQQQATRGWWQWLWELIGFNSKHHRQQQYEAQLPHHQQQQHSYFEHSHAVTRRLQQQVLPSGPFTPDAFCSKQMAFPYSKLLPFQAVDWLRAGAVRGPKAQPSNCSNSFAFVAAALAESTMAMQGYNGSAQVSCFAP
jgi:hypothetical protein